MGREIIKKDIQFPVSQKSTHTFIFIGYPHLSNIDENQELAAHLEEINTMLPHIKISFFGNISFNRIAEKEILSFDQSLAILSNIKNQFQLPIISNLGDWDHLEKAITVSDILCIDDYLTLNKSKMESFLALKKPCIIHQSLLNPQELQNILQTAEKFKTPVSLLTDKLDPYQMEFYQDHFVCLSVSNFNEKLIHAASILGIKGFYFSLEPDQKIDLKLFQKLFQ